jgi:hypothetical protein
MGRYEELTVKVVNCVLEVDREVDSQHLTGSNRHGHGLDHTYKR